MKLAILIFSLMTAQFATASEVEDLRGSLKGKISGIPLQVDRLDELQSTIEETYLDKGWDVVNDSSSYELIGGSGSYATEYLCLRGKFDRTNYRKGTLEELSKSCAVITYLSNAGGQVSIYLEAYNEDSEFESASGRTLNGGTDLSRATLLASSVNRLGQIEDCIDLRLELEDARLSSLGDYNSDISEEKAKEIEAACAK